MDFRRMKRLESDYDGTSRVIKQTDGGPVVMVVQRDGTVINPTAEYMPVEVGAFIGLEDSAGSRIMRVHKFDNLFCYMETYQWLSNGHPRSSFFSPNLFVPVT